MTNDSNVPASVEKRKSSHVNASTIPILMDLLLWSILWLGVGVLVGFVSFYFLWRTQCSVLLDKASHRSDDKIAEWQANHWQVNESYHRCINQLASAQVSMAATSLSTTDIVAPGSKVETVNTADVTGLLKAQTHLASKHQDLLDKHEETLNRLLQAEKAQESSTKIIQSLEEQLKKLQRNLSEADEAQLKAHQKLDSLKQQLTFQQSLVRQKVDEMEDLKKASDCHHMTARYEDEVVRFKAALRRRNGVECWTQYGPGPYRVRFSLEWSSSTTDLVIEFNHLNDMPHTLWTFLNLVTHGLYDGTTLMPSTSRDPPNQPRDTLLFDPGRGKLLTGGHPVKDSSSKQIQSKLLRHYAEIGYDSQQPLLFEEASPQAPCQVGGAFGLLGRGPSLMIYLAKGSGESGEIAGRKLAAVDRHEDEDESSEDEMSLGLSCPGRIVQGQEILQSWFDLMEDTNSANRIRIARAVIMSDARRGPDEL